MTESAKNLKPSLPATDPERVEELPPEVEVTRADLEERLDLDPEEQPNRPEQPDFDPKEREQLQGSDADEAE